VLIPMAGLYLQAENPPTGGLLALGGAFFAVMFAIAAVFIAALWKVFRKAGQPGWAALIPIYNFYILLKIAGKPGWWLLLLLVPFVNLVIFILISIEVAKAFGRSPAFGVILLFLVGGIGYLILGFGGAQYSRRAAAAA